VIKLSTVPVLCGEVSPSRLAPSELAVPSFQKIIFPAALGSPSVVLSYHNQLALATAQRNVKAN